MNQRKAKDVIDAFERIERFTNDRPPLPKGVLPSYMKLVDWIYQLSLKGRVKISDLADAMHLTRPGITRSCKSMEELGLIKKTVNENDRRIVYVSLTEKGTQYYFRYIEKYYHQLSARLEKYEGEHLDDMVKLIHELCDDFERNPICMEEEETDE